MTTNPTALPLRAEDTNRTLDLEVNRHEVHLRIDNRHYRIRGLERNMSLQQLRVNVLASRDELVHMDTLDLCKAKSRSAFVKATADELYVDQQVVKKDIGRMLLALEQLQQQRIEDATQPEDTTVQLTDIHVGPMIGNGFIRGLVDRTNALEPDIIAITGDLVDGSVADLAPHVAPLAELRARHGVYFCTGNHEYYSGADEWVAHLRSLGITVLENERVTIDHEGEPLAIAGVRDWTSGQFGEGHDMAAALADKDPEVPALLLAHQPLHVDEAATHGVKLQLSGHTHGGQIFPFNYLVRLQQPYIAGLHDHQGTKLYVSSGTGYWGPPMRLAIPAEITHLELARG